MKEHTLSHIYRLFMCSIALAVIFAAGALRLTGFFSPEELEQALLQGYGGFGLPVTLREEESMDPALEPEVKTEINTPDDTKASNLSVYPITEIDMSSGARAGQVLVRDSDSGQRVDVATLLSAPYPAALRQESVSRLSTDAEPLVLIIHTHATESFTKEGDRSYTADSTFRSEDKSENMVAVGAALAGVLNERGIPTLHCDVLHDAEDYNLAYDRSLATVKQYLEAYPSIRYVFDLHRDAMIRDSGEALKPVCSINGKDTAQVMILVGTDAGGADHPLWRENNMNLAVKLQHRLTTDCQGMARPINLRKLSFHQQYAPGSLLFEIGSCANTLEEAKRAAVNLGYVIADVISGS